MAGKSATVHRRSRRPRDRLAGNGQAVDGPSRLSRCRHRAHTEKYNLPVTWSEGDTRLELLGRVNFPCASQSLGLVPCHAAGGIEANLVDDSGPARQGFRACGRLRQRCDPARLHATTLGSTWADLSTSTCTHRHHRSRDQRWRRRNPVDGSARASASVPAHQHRATASSTQFRKP